MAGVVVSVAYPQPAGMWSNCSPLLHWYQCRRYFLYLRGPQQEWSGCSGCPDGFLHWSEPFPQWLVSKGKQKLNLSAWSSLFAPVKDPNVPYTDRLGGIFPGDVVVKVWVVCGAADLEFLPNNAHILVRLQEDVRRETKLWSKKKSHMSAKLDAPNCH